MYTSSLITELVVKRIVYDETNTDVPKPLRGVSDGSGYRDMARSESSAQELGRSAGRENRGQKSEKVVVVRKRGNACGAKGLQWKRNGGKGVAGRKWSRRPTKGCAHAFGGVEHKSRPETARTAHRTRRETSSATTRESGTVTREPSEREGSSTRGAGCGKSARPVLTGGGRTLRGRPALPTKKFIFPLAFLYMICYNRRHENKGR